MPHSASERCDAPLDVRFPVAGRPESVTLGLRRTQTVFMTSAYRSPAGAEHVQTGVAPPWRGGRSRIRRTSVDTSLGMTHVVSLGAGNHVCVYLPGTNFNASSSTMVLGALAAKFRVYAADLPGQPGLSAANRPDDEHAGYAGWVTEMVDWVTRRDGQSADLSRRPLPWGRSRTLGRTRPR